MTDSSGQILDALYKLFIIDHREENEKLGQEIVSSKADGKKMKIVVAVKTSMDDNAIKLVSVKG